MRTPLLYRICDGFTEAVIYFMVVFSPRAFGTTQDWSIWTMNVCGYLLGVLFITEWLVRSHTGFRPELWEVELEDESQCVGSSVRRLDSST